MEDDRKSDGKTKKLHYFTKLHEKVMMKFAEMQNKLEKSKSLDCLVSSNNSAILKGDQSCNENDVPYKDQIFDKTGVTRSRHHSFSVEDVVKYHAQFQDIHSERARMHFEDELWESDLEDFSEQVFSTADNASNTESLLQEKEHNSHQTPPTPLRARKMSIREKIGNRISIAKEKRQEGRERKRDSVKRVEKFILSNTIQNDIPLNKRNKTATVTVALIEATGLEFENTANDKLWTLFCRLRLGAEKRKSKVIKSNTAAVSWHELFNFNMYDETLLEIILLDKDVSLGRASIDLAEVTQEKTHQMNLSLKEGNKNITIFILLTISGTMANTFTETEKYKESPVQLEKIRDRFAWYNIQKDLTEIGWLSVTVYGAKGLAASETYCVLELGNERLQTHTYYKSQDPIWIKMFSFAVTDVTTILEVTVWDERKYEVIGRISIRLLQIINSKKTWYALKDVAQRGRAKGNNPRILLEMNFVWNLIKASIRVINPKESKYLETETKFDRHIFSRNWSRAKIVLNWVIDAVKVVKTCFEWESRDWNIVSLVIWLFFCWFFKPWMVPLLFLVPFALYKPSEYFIIYWKNNTKTEPTFEESNEKVQEENLSLLQKIHSLQEIIQTLQETIGNFATLGESVKNLYNFTEPFLSNLAIFLIVIISLVMFVIPVKYLFMFWGCYKFARKMLRPNRIPNNEVLDLLSRVPDDEILLNCKELPLQELSAEDILI